MQDARRAVYLVKKLFELGRPGLHEGVEVGHRRRVDHRLCRLAPAQLPQAVDPCIQRLRAAIGRWRPSVEHAMEQVEAKNH